MRNQRLYWYSQRKNTLTSIVENINPFIQVSSVKMNYKELFNERSVANAMKRTLRSAKYTGIGIQNFHEIDGSQLVRHHRNEDNFFKDVAACVIGAPQELHRKTSAKYGTICYHLYRNKNQVMQGLFEGWFFFLFFYIYLPSVSLLTWKNLLLAPRSLFPWGKKHLLALIKYISTAINDIFSGINHWEFENFAENYLNLKEVKNFKSRFLSSPIVKWSFFNDFFIVFLNLSSQLTKKYLAVCFNCRWIFVQIYISECYS